MSKMKKFGMGIFVVWWIFAIAFVTIKVHNYLNPEKVYKEERITLSNDIKNQRVIEKEKVLLESKKVIKIVGYEEKNKKEYEYKDNEFYLKMTKIKASDSMISKMTKDAWNSLKGSINDVGERTYYQVGYYEVAYGIDTLEKPLEIDSIDEETGIVKIKEPTISLLYFSMPFDEMEFSIEDKTDLSKGKIKITKEFTTKDRQKLYEDLVHKAKKELEKENKEVALMATKEAIRELYSKVDRDIVIEFVQ